MPTGSYSIAFNEKLYFATGTTASTIPTSSSGLTQITSLTDASLKGTSEKTANIIDFDSTLGFGAQLIKVAAYSMPMTMNLDPTAGAYRLLKSTWSGGPGGSVIRWFRQSPALGGTGSVNGEINRGLGVIEGFDESRKAGEVITVNFTLVGYGAPLYHYQGNVIATCTVTNAGTGLTAGTYSAKPLVNVTDGSGLNATANITVTGSTVSGITFTGGATGGTNYKVGDVLTVAVADVGGTGTVMPTFTVATIS